ncbi:hypothetical protein G3O08_06690 [Cryomorpha ignava]|uniref:Uncharacterized protein n=1 Tax=Cryomorpha ignava TaxID=101383 RepID=A0A7K3WR45_9FLAO|nr:hypothetical protein [Cryomorpha ignava]NEN23185.1 hypothetical protein [Cryomorpha ignava]
MKKAILIFVLLSFLLACQKDPTSWDTSLSAPLIRTNLGIGDLIPDSILQIGSDQSVAIRIEENIFDIGIDSLIAIEPDTVSKIFSIAPLLQFTFNPGQTFYNSDESFEFNGVEAQLSQAILKGGKLILNAENSIDGDLNFILKIPKAFKNGESLLISETIPAASGNENGLLNREIDISGYELDLTGQNGNEFNVLAVQFTLSNPANGEPITAVNSDIVKLSVSYTDLDVQFAKGYFGTEALNLNESSIFNAFDGYNDAMIDVDEVNAELSFTNGFGIDIQASIFQIKAWNNFTENSVNLSNSLIGSNINLSRAGLNGYDPLPSAKNYVLNNFNSNITELLELLPDSIFINANASLNPLGNISNYNDFVSDKSRLRCDLSLLIPMKLSLTNLSIRDTTKLEWPGNENFSIESGNLYLAASNSFPANFLLEINAIDGSNNVVLKLNPYLENPEGLISGRNGDEPSNSLLKFSLDDYAVNQLKNSKSIAIKANFETTNYPETVIFNENDSLKILISSDLNSRLTF